MCFLADLDDSDQFHKGVCLTRAPSLQFPVAKKSNTGGLCSIQSCSNHTEANGASFGSAKKGDISSTPKKYRSFPQVPRTRHPDTYVLSETDLTQAAVDLRKVRIGISTRACRCRPLRIRRFSPWFERGLSLAAPFHGPCFNPPSWDQVAQKKRCGYLRSTPVA